MLLSICITTYGRAEYIIETVQSILQQLSDECELIILDSNENNVTFERLQDLKRYYDGKNFQVVKNAENGGLDKDFDKVIGLASSDYCWPFPDDDILLPGSLQYVIDNLREGVDVVVVNSIISSKDYSDIIVANALNFTLPKTYSIKNADEYSKEILSYNSYIGSVITNRSLWFRSDNSRYYGSMFVHIGVIFSNQDLEILVLPKPVINLRYGNASWADQSFIIWAILWPKIVYESRFFSNLTKIGNIHRQPASQVKFLAYHRMLGNLSIATIRHHYNLLTFYQKLLIILISFIPRFALHLLALFLLRASGSHNHLIRYNVFNNPQFAGITKGFVKYFGS